MRRRGHIIEAFAFDIAIQPIVAPVGHEQVREPIVIVVARAHALRPARGAQTDLVGHIPKTLTAFVAIHPIRAAFARQDE